MARVELPDFIRADLQIFLKSESAGINTTIRLGNMKVVPDVTANDATVQRAVDNLRKQFGLDDLRFMTAEEVKQYLEDEEEERSSSANMDDNDDEGVHFIAEDD